MKIVIRKNHHVLIIIMSLGSVIRGYKKDQQQSKIASEASRVATCGEKNFSVYKNFVHGEIMTRVMICMTCKICVCT